MKDKFEELIKLAYQKWKSDAAKPREPHPDEETFACFLERKLTAEENEALKAHLVKCETCAQVLSAQAKPQTDEDVPEALVERARNLVIADEDKSAILEILLRFKERAIEILNTTGDVLVGRELMPAPVLRSRKLSDFKDEVLIFKDFKNIRVELKLENKGVSFSLTVLAKEKETQKGIKDLRVTLLKDALELESYLGDSGKVTFENVLLGKYTVEISTVENKLASILLDIKT